MSNIILNESQFKTFLSLVNQKANEADRTPTEKQAKAGNYKMGHLRFGGFEITIENPRGSYRKFKNPDGSTGQIQMHNHYGYFTSTVGKDGDQIDVFLGTNTNFTKVYVVDQYINGKFDESKVMLGFSSIEEAKHGYLNNFSSDWKGFKKITGVSINFFKKWLYDGYRQRKPFYQYVDVKKKKIEQLKESKLALDKYYTPDEEAEKCIRIFQTTAEKNGWNVTEYVEPSAGSGIFSNKIDNCLAFDIAPEGNNIQQADFMKLEMPYKEGRCVIGNPPYGDRMIMAQRFLRKAAMIGDYIAFVLPISQLNNNRAIPDFDLVVSVPLGDVKYSGIRNVKTCFNIYARSKDATKRTINKLQDVTIIRSDNPNYDSFEADIRMVGWGNAGQILGPNDRKRVEEYKIKVNNPELKDKVVNVLSTANWKEETNSTAAPKIKKFQIINLLKREIPEIQ